MVELIDALFLGDGNHKAVYTDPRDPQRCIKIMHHLPDSDLSREMSYRKALGKRAEQMSLLTRFYGTVETSKGEGYVFERVLDYDGSVCKTMLNVMDEAAVQPERTDEVKRMLMQFKQDYFSQQFLVAGMDPDNFLVQRISPEASKVRIIDNIGCSAAIPLAYYIGWIRARRVRKYWKRFVEEEMRGHYGAVLGGDFLEELGR